MPTTEGQIKRDNELLDEWIKNGAQQPSAELWERIESGIRSARKPMVHNLADDACQAAAEKIARGLQRAAGRIALTRGDQEEKATPPVAYWNRKSPLDRWAYTVAYHVYLDILKSSWFRKTTPLKETDTSLPDTLCSLSTEELLILYEGREQARGWLNDLFHRLESPHIEVLQELAEMIDKGEWPSVSELSRRLNDRYPTTKYYRQKVYISLAYIRDSLKVTGGPPLKLARRKK